MSDKQILRVAIITASDRSASGERPDFSGPAFQEAVTAWGWQVTGTIILPDDQATLAGQMRQWAEEDFCDILLCTGGTGFAPRDVSPEAARQVIERLTPGLDEAMRAASLQIHPHAMLSRAVSGIRKRTLIITLPGSPKGAVENLRVLAPALPHALELLREIPGSEHNHMRK